MNISRVFTVFSRRNPRTTGKTPLTPEFRNRVLLLWSRVFPKDDLVQTKLWVETYDKLLYSLGRQRLSTKYASSPHDDLINFVGECTDEHFLDFIELSFQANSIHDAFDRMSGDRVHVSELVNHVNTFLEIDGLPYYLTGFTIRDSQIGTYPRIIPRDNELSHQEMIKPTLELLTQPIFGTANEEFLDALKDFRNADYRDCVVKCGSSLESVMKIICDENGWPYQQTDTAKTLLENIFPRTRLDSYFQQPIMLVATVRNRSSTAHGAGTQQKTVSRHVASYVVNATAAAILLLAHECNP